MPLRLPCGRFFRFAYRWFTISVFILPVSCVLIWAAPVKRYKRQKFKLKRFIIIFYTRSACAFLLLADHPHYEYHNHKQQLIQLYFLVLDPCHYIYRGSIALSCPAKPSFYFPFLPQQFPDYHYNKTSLSLELVTMGKNLFTHHLQYDRRVRKMSLF